MKRYFLVLLVATSSMMVMCQGEQRRRDISFLKRGIGALCMGYALMVTSASARYYECNNEVMRNPWEKGLTRENMNDLTLGEQLMCRFKGRVDGNDCLIYGLTEQQHRDRMTYLCRRRRFGFVNQQRKREIDERTKKES